MKAAGYSGTSLVAKLGIKPAARLQFFGAPKNFGELLGELPVGAKESQRGKIDCAIAFVTTRADLARRFDAIVERLETNGMLWISWPKKTSGVATQLTENVVREIGLAAGLVDVKVCAIDQTWSGLKFVRRLRDR